MRGMLLVIIIIIIFIQMSDTYNNCMFRLKGKKLC